LKEVIPDNPAPRSNLTDQRQGEEDFVKLDRREHLAGSSDQGGFQHVSNGVGIAEEDDLDGVRFPRSGSGRFSHA